MNKQELTNKTQLDAKTLSAILDAANIPNNLDNYTDEHFEVIRALREIRIDKKVQTWPEAFVIYIKPIREIQLEEIAFRHTIVRDRIPEILAGMKLKPETLTDEDLTHFESVCQQIQSGIAFEMAVQSASPQKQAKGKKTPAIPEFAPQPDGEVVGGAIVKTDNPLPDVVLSRGLEEIEGIHSDEMRAKLAGIAQIEADDISSDLAREPFAGLIEESDRLREFGGGGRNIGVRVLHQVLQQKLRDPGFVDNAVDDLLKKRQAERDARKQK